VHSAGLNPTRDQWPIRRSGPWHSGAVACRRGLAHGDVGLAAHSVRAKRSPRTGGGCGAIADNGSGDAV
jgi:hypothetical protein